MLTVLDEDVLDMLAEAFEHRILNQEADNDGAFIEKNRSSRFVEYPRDASVDRRDGVGAKRTNLVHVEEEIVMSFAEEGPKVVGVSMPPTAPLTPLGKRSRICCGGRTRYRCWPKPRTPNR